MSHARFNNTATQKSVWMEWCSFFSSNSSRWWLSIKLKHFYSMFSPTKPLSSSLSKAFTMFWFQFWIQQTCSGVTLLPFRDAINALRLGFLFLILVSHDRALGSILLGTCVCVMFLNASKRSRKRQKFLKEYWLLQGSKLGMTQSRTSCLQHRPSR